MALDGLIIIFRLDHPAKNATQSSFFVWGHPKLTFDYFYCYLKSDKMREMESLCSFLSRKNNNKQYSIVPNSKICTTGRYKFESTYQINDKFEIVSPVIRTSRF